MPPLKKRWGSAVPAAGTAHTASCSQSPLQLLHMVVGERTQHSSPHPFCRKQEVQAPRLPFPFLCLSTLPHSSKSKDQFCRSFWEALVFWRNANDIKFWVGERRGVSGTQGKAGLSMGMNKGRMRRCFQNSDLLPKFKTDRPYFDLEGGGSAKGISRMQ